MDCLQGTPVRDHPRGVVSALDLRAAEDLVGIGKVLAVAGFREVDIHRVLDFDQRVVAVAIFRSLQAEAVSVRLVMFAARFMMGHASGIIHAISVGRQDISGGTAPIEDPVRLEFQGQVLSSSGLVGMKDLIRRQGRPRGGSFSMGQQSAPAARGRGQRGRPPASGRVYAMTSQEAQATPDVVTGTLSIFGDDARVLIDPGATHSFISREYVSRVGITPIHLECGLEIATPIGESLWPSQMLKGSLFSIEG